MVVASTPIDGVVAERAVDDVVAVTAIDQIGSGLAADGVVPPVAVNAVGSNGAGLPTSPLTDIGFCLNFLDTNNDFEMFE